MRSHKANQYGDDEEDKDEDDYNYDNDDMIDNDIYGTKRQHHRTKNSGSNVNDDDDDNDSDKETNDRLDNNFASKSNVIFPLGYKAGKGEAVFAFTPSQRTHLHDDYDGKINHARTSHCKDQMIVAGLGSGSSCTVRDYRLAVTNAVRLAKQARCTGIVFDLNNVLPYSDNSEHTITVTTEQDLFHKPQPLK